MQKFSHHFIDSFFNSSASPSAPALLKNLFPAKTQRKQITLVQPLTKVWQSQINGALLAKLYNSPAFPLQLKYPFKRVHFSLATFHQNLKEVDGILHHPDISYPAVLNSCL